MVNQALSGLKVVDFSWHIAGPYCTKLLADFGAEVIKIERPELGDPSREEGPFPGDKKDLNASGLYLYLNNNKKSIELNLASEKGKRIARELIKKADIVVENFAPGVMERLGLGYDSIKELQSNIIMTSISNFGQTGEFTDYEATELITQAMSGWVTSVGEVEYEPLRAAGRLRILEYLSGAFAALSTLSAVLERRKTNEGTHIDVSITEVGNMQRSYPTVQDSFPSRASKTEKRFRMLPSVEKCKDGYIGVTVLTGQHWENFCAMTEMYDWIDDERFTMISQRLKHKEIYQKRFDEWLMRHTRQEIIELGAEWGVPVIPVPSFDELPEFPQYKDRNVFIEVEHAYAGKVIQPAAPARLSKTPWQLKSVAPTLGEHNKNILKNIDNVSKEGIEEANK